MSTHKFICYKVASGNSSLRREAVPESQAILRRSTDPLADFCYVIHAGTGSMGQQIINSSLRVMNASDAMTWLMEMHL